MRHKLFVLTVKKFLQSVYIYGSYRKIKTGVPFFLDHPVYWAHRAVVFAIAQLSCNIVYVLGLRNEKAVDLRTWNTYYRICLHRGVNLSVTKSNNASSVTVDVLAGLTERDDVRRLVGARVGSM